MLEIIYLKDTTFSNRCFNLVVFRVVPFIMQCFFCTYFVKYHTTQQLEMQIVKKNNN